jgi:hypothetical protein
MEAELLEARPRADVDAPPPDTMAVVTGDWTKEEKQFLAAESYRLYDETDQYSRLGSVKAAVELLPEHRRVALADWHAVKKWVLKDWAYLDSITGKEHATKARPYATKVPRRDPNYVSGRIFWSKAENETVAHEAARLMHHDRNLTKLAALREAQKLLPPERQKTITYKNQTKTAYARLVELQPVVAKAEEKRLAKEIKERETQQQIEALQKREYKLEPEQEQAPPLPIVPIPALDSYQGLLGQLAGKVIGDFMATLGAQVTRIVEAKVAEALANLKMPEFEIPRPSSDAVIPGDVQELKTPPKNRLPKVCVVGLLNQQAEDAKRAFLGTVEFVFVKSQKQGGSGAGGVGMVNAARTCDVAIAMTSFVGHDVDNHRKDLNCPFVRLNGSVSDLKRWMRQWLNGEIALAA